MSRTVGKIHPTDVEASTDRLLPMYRLLLSRGEAGATSFELAQAGRVNNVSGAVAEIRDWLERKHPEQTIPDSEQDPELSRGGRKVYRYHLVVGQSPATLSSASAEPSWAEKRAAVEALRPEHARQEALL